ncbi:MAG: WD40 repeat domain-containing protein [bacterium]
MVHEDSVEGVRFVPGGSRLITASADGTARAWNVLVPDSTWRKAATFNPAYLPVARAAGGARLLLAASTVKCLSTAGGALLGETRPVDGLYQGIRYTPDGTRAAVGDWNGGVQVVDGTTLKPTGSAVHTEGGLSAWALSPDGKILVGAGYTATAWLWDASTGAPLAPAHGHSGAISAAAFSQDGHRLATAGFDNGLRFWDPVRRALMGAPFVLKAGSDRLLFSPDGRKLLVASWFGECRMWDADRRAPLGETMFHSMPLTTAAFSPDGTRVYTGSYDRTVRIWDAATGHSVSRPVRHPNFVMSLAVSPGGDVLATGCFDGQARLWDAMTGAPLGPALAGDSDVILVGFVGTGRVIVVVTRGSVWKKDMTSWFETVAPAELIRRVERVARRRVGPRGELETVW